MAVPDEPELPDIPLTQLMLSAETTTPLTNPSDLPLGSDPPTAQISLHALLGHAIPQTLRVAGHIAKNPVAILVDSGSTHNFVQDRVAKCLGLTMLPAQSFDVLVGNGEQLQCSFLCQQVKLSLDPHHFFVDLFV